MLNNAFIKIAEYLKFIDLNNYAEDNIIINGKKINRHKKKCDDIIRLTIEEYNNCKNKLNIVGIASDINDNIIFNNNINSIGKKYILAYKSIDGLANMYTNINCGTIYAIYEYDNINNSLVQIFKTGYCIYGTSTILIETENNKLKMYKLNKTNDFIFKKYISFEINKNDKQKIYSINQSYNYSQDIIHVLRSYKMKNYSQRWIGTMVADCHRILINDGIFIYTTTLDKINNSPKNKIALLYQGYPFAYIFKIAGGLGLDGNYNDILNNIKNFKLNNIHFKSPIILCSYKFYNEFLESIKMYEDTRF